MFPNVKPRAPLPCTSLPSLAKIERGNFFVSKKGYSRRRPLHISGDPAGHLTRLKHLEARRRSEFCIATSRERRNKLNRNPEKKNVGEKKRRRWMESQWRRGWETINKGWKSKLPKQRKKENAEMRKAIEMNEKGKKGKKIETNIRKD